LCGPEVPWDWFIIDTSYVLVLIGGAMIFRSKRTSLTAWVAFGAFATFVGTILAYETVAANTAFAAASAASDAVAQLKASC